MRKYKKLRFLTIIFVALCFPAIAIYSDYNSLAEADFLINGFQFESLDLEDFVADKQDFHFFSGQVFLSNPLGAILYSCILAAFWQGILSDQKSFILRC